MPVRMRAEVRIGQDRTAAVLLKVSNLSDEYMLGLAHDITVQARANAAALPFQESTGNLARSIEDQRIGKQHYRIQTTSGYASFIEFGTQFIKGQMPFLWPAYRAMKRKFLRGGPWV